MTLKKQKINIKLILTVIAAILLLIHVYNLRERFINYDSFTTGATGDAGRVAFTSGETLSQDFVSNGQYLNKITVTLTGTDYTNLPEFELSDGDKVIASGQLELKSKKYVADIGKWISMGKTYTFTIKINAADVSYYCSVISDENAEYHLMIDGVQSDCNVMNLTTEFISAELMQIIPIVLLVAFSFFMTLTEITDKKIRKICEFILIALADINLISAVNMLCNTAWKSTIANGTAAATILIVLFIIMIFACYLSSIRKSLIIASVFFTIFGIASHYTLLFRGMPFVPSDLTALGTLEDVVGGYSYSLDAEMVYAFVITILIIVDGFAIEKSEKKSKKRITAGIISGTALLAVGLIMILTPAMTNLTGVIPYYWKQNWSAKNYGQIYNFAANTQNIFHKKPSGYSEDELDTIFSEYVSDDTSDIETSELPDIIVIMNESWSNINIENGLGNIESVTPNIDQMRIDGIVKKGNVLVSTVGAGTNKSEFEFLTGSNFNFGLTSAIYSEECDDGTNSIVSSLSDLGYYTVAMHPANRKNWDRDIGYEKLGFDEFLAIDWFSEVEELEYLRPKYKYPSDDCVFNALEIALESERPAESSPMFMFCITYQNHSGYIDEDYVATIDAGTAQDNQYLSLVKETDQAYENLIDYLSKTDRKTIVLMFGDHLPKVDNLYELVDSESMDIYTTPYVIYSNYIDVDDMDSVPSFTKLSYLGPELIETAGLPLTGYGKFLLRVSDACPILFEDKVYNSNKKEIASSDETEEFIKEYKIIQYNNLQDDDHDNEFYHYQ